MQTFGRLGVVIVILLLAASCTPAVPTAVPTKPAAPAAPTQPGAPAAATTAPAAAPTAAPKPTAPPAPKVKRGGILVRIDVRDATSWDPAFSTNSSEVAEGPALEAPLRYDLVDDKVGKHEIRPWLAESYEVKDPKTVILKFRKGIKYHDGTDLTAETVKWALDRVREHPKSLSKAFHAAVDSVQAVDAQTVQLNLKFPSATTLINLTNAAGGTGSTGTLLTSKAAFEKLGEEAIARKPMGTGPFEMVDWKRDDRTTYKKFNDYWKQGADGQKLPYLDGIEVRIVRDRTVAVIELKSGNGHIMTRLDAKDIASAKSSPDLVFFNMPWASIRGLAGFNSDKEPFGKSLKLRQAAQYAIDRDSLAKTISMEWGVPGYHFVWIPGFLGYDEKMPKYEFNADKARQLLRETGFADGVSVKMASASGPDQRVAEVIQAMWDKVGIKSVVDVMEDAAFKSAAQSGLHESVVTNAFPSPDPDAMARSVVCKGSANWASYCNSKVDDCMKEGTAIYDEKQRADHYRKCYQVMYEDAGVFGTVHTPWNVVSRKEVKNLRTNQHLLDMREVWLDK
ncbi:MAG: ABC transporter substrate-binding protein [Chloroflexi bacterium]|nr:ABC transporter substrate-binding protein [Chloroflexota bacterium]